MSTLTCKFAMVLPKDVRKDMNLKPGTKVTMVKNKEGQWVLVREEQGIWKWVGYRRTKMSAAQEMALLRGRPEDDFR